MPILVPGAKLIAKDFAEKSDDELFTILETNLEVLIRLRDMESRWWAVKDGTVWRQAMADIAEVRRALDAEYRDIGGVN